MTLLKRISPIDGRYADKTAALADYFSEYALIKTRIEIEIEYLIFLSDQSLKGIGPFSENDKNSLRHIYQKFDDIGAENVKQIEKTTNHDVKAIEYYIKSVCQDLKIDFNYEFIHFGLTSQDINNTSFPLMLKRYSIDLYLPAMESLINELRIKANEWKEITILARTHGQPASPTTLGKEIMVFVERLEKQLSLLKSARHTAKFGGATGNFNAHKVAYPDTDWNLFGQKFLEILGLERQRWTTQIEHYDDLGHILDTTKRIHTILIDFSRDIWSYISFDIFGQKIVATETGSSAMPHKVNPIDFENAEGNLLYSNSILEFLSSKLPISRLQRDLTDSTVLRNIGVPFAHFHVAHASLMKGIGKLLVNQKRIDQELEDNWIVIAEAIQTILRREGIQNPYEMLKDFSRQTQKPNKDAFKLFISSLPVSDSVKMELEAISPQNYCGYKYDL